MKRKTNSIDSIVIHHSYTQQPDMDKLVGSIDSSHSKRLHTTPNGFWNHIAYHYIIQYDGEVRHTRPLDEIWYHASDREENKESIGICFSGQFDEEKPTKAQYLSWQKLIKELQERLGSLSVRWHNSFSSKTCPWTNFDLTQLLKIIMWFYEKHYKATYGDIPRDDKIIKEPVAAWEKIKDLSADEQLRELIFLVCSGFEKIGLKK